MSADAAAERDAGNPFFELLERYQRKALELNRREAGYAVSVCAVWPRDDINREDYDVILPMLDVLRDHDHDGLVDHMQDYYRRNTEHRLHVGCGSSNAQFVFRGYRDKTLLQTPDLRPIQSFRDWKRVSELEGVEFFAHFWVYLDNRRDQLLTETSYAYLPLHCRYLRVSVSFEDLRQMAHKSKRNRSAWMFRGMCFPDGSGNLFVFHNFDPSYEHD